MSSSPSPSTDPPPVSFHSTPSSQSHARAILQSFDQEVIARCQAAIAHGTKEKPITRLYRTLNDLHTQSLIYECESDLPRSYMMSKTLCRFFLHIITSHPSFNMKALSRERDEWTRKVKETLTKVEGMHQQLFDMYERDYHQQLIEEERLKKLELEAAAAREQKQREEQEARDYNLAIQLAQQNQQRHQQQRTDMGDARGVAPVVSASPSAAPSVHSGIPPTIAGATSMPSSYPCLQPPPPQPQPSSLESRPRPLPPAASPFPPSYGHSPSVMPIASAPELQIATPPQPVPSLPSARHRNEPVINTTLRPIHVPTNILADFYTYAERNTLANIETCGILCGRFDSSTKDLWITHCILPNQTATSDTCVTNDEETLTQVQIEKDLLTLGWIHTHPSQTCFLSSVDLHTHFSYQLMLNESIAIVLAPKHQPNSGVFHCTLQGMKALTHCQRTGFHQHHEPFPLYAIAPHYRWESSPQHRATFIDLRTSHPLAHTHTHAHLAHGHRH